MIEKKKLSKDWKKRLQNGELIKAAEQGTLLELLKDFPNDLELPEEILKIRSPSSENVLIAAARTGHLDQLTEIAKKHQLDLTPVLYEKGGIYDDSVIGTGITWKHLDQVISMAKELKLDLKPLFYEKSSVTGFNILHLAACAGSKCLEQVLTMAKEFDLDLKPVINDGDKKGKTFFDYAEGRGCKAAAEAVQGHVRKQTKEQELMAKVKEFKKTVEEKQKTKINPLTIKSQNSR